MCFMIRICHTFVVNIFAFWLAIQKTNRNRLQRNHLKHSQKVALLWLLGVWYLLQCAYYFACCLPLTLARSLALSLIVWTDSSGLLIVCHSKCSRSPALALPLLSPTLSLSVFVIHAYTHTTHTHASTPTYTHTYIQ